MSDLDADDDDFDAAISHGETKLAFNKAKILIFDLLLTLKPFAELAKIFDHDGGNRPKLDEDMIASWADHRVNGGEDIGFTVGQLRAARAAIERAKEAGYE